MKPDDLVNSKTVLRGSLLSLREAGLLLSDAILCFRKRALRNVMAGTAMTLADLRTKPPADYLAKQEAGQTALMMTVERDLGVEKLLSRGTRCRGFGYG
jgi:hypothetical protein